MGETPGDAAPLPTPEGVDGKADADGAWAPASERDPNPGPGTMIGRYVVLDRIGEGGLGAVLLAYDPELARRVAIKVIRTGIVSAHARARMVREARAMAKLSHPNVVAIYDVGTYGNNIYLALEYVEGETLETWLHRPGRPPRTQREVLAVMKQAGRGLAAAHAAGIVHRDFKPSNVVIAKDARVRVLDFGIAFGALQPDPTDDVPLPAVSVSSLANLSSRVSGLISGPISSQTSCHVSEACGDGARGERLTEEGAIVGTVGYFAPEAAFEQPSDCRADIFSFCVTLWRALTGRSPFPETSITEYLDAIFDEPRARLRDPRAPEWLAKAIERGLSTAADDRYASVDEMLLALDNAEAWRAPIAIGILALAIVVTATATWDRARRDAEVSGRCRAEADAIATSWGPSVRDRVERAMGTMGDAPSRDRAERTLAELDDYARTWRDEQAASCEATLIAKTQSVAVHENRSRCLTDERTRLEVVAELLAGGDARVHQQSLAEVAALASPRLCAEAPFGNRFRSLLVDANGGTAARETAVAARREAFRAEALITCGCLDEARDVATRALSLAHETGDGALEANAEHVLGTTLAARFENDEALVHERQAVSRAEAVGADAIGGLGAAATALLLFERMHRPGEAEVWQELARAKLVRLGGDVSLARAIERNDDKVRALHSVLNSQERGTSE